YVSRISPRSTPFPYTTLFRSCGCMAPVWPSITDRDTSIREDSLDLIGRSAHDRWRDTLHDPSVVRCAGPATDQELRPAPASPPRPRLLDRRSTLRRHDGLRGRARAAVRPLPGARGVRLARRHPRVRRV